MAVFVSFALTIPCVRSSFVHQHRGAPITQSGPEPELRRATGLQAGSGPHILPHLTTSEGGAAWA
jgi:hypothetical protein